jgi:hypothetical protein
MVVINYAKTQPTLRAAMGTGCVIPYPKCDKCNKSDAVREHPGIFSSEWECLRCKVGWMMPW